MDKRMVLEIKYGRMALDMKDNGETIRLTAKENWSMLMETSTKANGVTTKHTGSAATDMQMAPLMKVNGKKTNSMAREKSLGLMVRGTKVATKRERNTEREC